MSEPTGETSKRPKDTAFRQQRLPAWHPLITPKSVIPVFLLVAVVFVPLGIGMLVTTNALSEYSFDYTNCAALEGGGTCASQVAMGFQNCTCNITVTIPKTLDGTVYMYYGLTNFYQNHRRYVKSRDDVQLNGALAAAKTCDPLTSAGGAPYAPCGLIANSMFNDTLRLVPALGGPPIFQKSTGIAWTSDVDTKFNNPPPSSNLTLAFAGSLQPPNWPFSPAEIGNTAGHPNGPGFKNEDFIVWMRVAALPNFRKLYRIQENGLQAGDYFLLVDYNFPALNFEGTKSMIVTQSSWIGGKSAFLGVAYIVVGAICLLIGAFFILLNRIKPRALGDPALLKWSY